MTGNGIRFCQREFRTRRIIRNRIRSGKIRRRFICFRIFGRVGPGNIFTKCFRRDSFRFSCVFITRTISTIDHGSLFSVYFSADKRPTRPHAKPNAAIPNGNKRFFFFFSYASRERTQFSIRLQLKNGAPVQRRFSARTGAIESPEFDNRRNRIARMR